jgi:cell division protein ZapE
MLFLQAVSSGGFTAQLRAVASAHGFKLDPAQLSAAASFDRLQAELIAEEQGQSALLRWLRRPPAPRGIYLWGPVGRGKSFLMDIFFHRVPIAAKRRIHFHRFMQEIHHQLRDLQGREEPLRAIAERVGRDARLLCLDELHVVDIGDAMLMRGLLEGLLEQRVALVTTSNQQPDDLYLHGLQRAQFLPAIDLIKARLEVRALEGPSDYRLRALERAGVYHSPLGEAAEAAQAAAFEAVAGEPGTPDAELEIKGRVVHAIRAGPGVAWFAFSELCEGPRGTADYIELSRRYHTVLVSGVPQLRRDMTEPMRRFTWLVDEFYDRRVKLILSAAVPVTSLYEQVERRPDVERTRSRLIEMQTSQYLSQAHLA